MSYLAAVRKLADFKYLDMDDETIDRAAEMWASGMGTKEISFHLCCAEALVWNNMNRIKGR